MHIIEILNIYLIKSFVIEIKRDGLRYKGVFGSERGRYILLSKIVLVSLNT